MQAEAIYETVLYADNLDAAARFYTSVFGLKLLSQNDLMLVLQIGKQYLLVFDPSRSSLPNRLVPSHGTSGKGHVAFSMKMNEIDDWRQQLRAMEVEIESEIAWDDGKRGTSIYVRDPAGNSVELAPTILWSYLH